MTKTKKPVQKQRQRKKPQYSSFRLTKRIKPPIQKKLPSVYVLLRETLQHMWRYKKVYITVTAIYFVLNMVFVKGFANHIDIESLKTDLNQQSGLSGLGLSVSLIGIIAGSSASGTNGTANLYQTIIIIVCSLAFIWLFRQTHESRKQIPTTKQPFYEGMTPIIPFVLVLCVVGLQLLPMLAGVSVFNTIQANGLASTAIELVLWGLLAILLTLLSFYMLSSSLFALIIVTLPDMRPMAALKSARKVVAFRRWVIMRKMLVLCLLISLVYAVLLLLIIVTIPVFAEWFMAILSALLLPIIVGSGYKLYRALL